jgi:23S rRNA (guanosine2251-2'-O)-methyltransferase
LANTYLILDNIRSAENVGSLFRTADAAGVEKIFLIGYTPAPIDKFNRPNQKVKKASLGAEQTVDWESVSSLSRLINKLKKQGVMIIGLEQSPGAANYKNLKLQRPWALIVGNEVEGIAKKNLTHCDQVIEIPMSGSKESLNVSVAAGVALFRLRDR